MEISWTLQTDLSALHVAYCLLKWPDKCLFGKSAGEAESLRDAALKLDEQIRLLAVLPDRFWEMAFALSVDTPANRELAERILVRLLPAVARTQQRIGALGHAIGAVEAGFQEAFPRHQLELQLRQGPLQEQWEAYGPGLLFHIGRLTEPAAIAERAEIALVEPITGGWGMAHLATNRVHVEAVLTNADPELTETLRLAWLLSQLEFERPVYSDLINGLRLRQIAGLAMLPPALLAAQELGLASYSSPSVRRAIEFFRIDIWGEQSTPALTEIVLTWWETVETSRPAWRIALTGLDRMLDIR